MSRTAGEPGRSAVGALGRVCSVVAAAGFVGLALLGAVVSPPVVVFVLGPLCAALLAGLVAVAEDGPLRRPVAVRRVLVAAGAGLLLIPFCAGMAVLGPLGLAVLVVLLALAAVGCVARAGGLRSRPRPRLHVVTGPDAAGGAPLTTWPASSFVCLLPTVRLLEEWRSSRAQLCGGDPARRLEAVELRAELIEELARRHPDAVDRWLMEGGDQDPARYIGDDRDLAA